ncbi:hypothetical protein [Spirosoma areae]
MRYIALFTLFSLPVAKGFNSVDEAQNCLLEAQQDMDSSPLGLYDTLMNKVVLYQPESTAQLEADEELIIRIARDHAERVV